MKKEKHYVNKTYGGHQLSRYIDVYEVSANRCHSVPESGYQGTEATLVDEPAWNEKFSSYSITGATLTGNNFILNNDVTAQANYETAKNVTLETDGHGTISASPISGFSGTIVTLSNTPDTDYAFSSYDITGATLTGDQFMLNNDDVTVYANFYSTKVEEVTIGNQTWMAKNLEVDDGQGGIFIYDCGTVNGLYIGPQYYYTYDAAIRVANTIQGWRLPTQSEWIALGYSIGTSLFTAGNKLKSTAGWNNGNNGTDDYGFSGLPCGYISPWGNAGSIGTYTYFRTPDSAGSYATVLMLQDNGRLTYSNEDFDRYFNIRLIKDT